MGGEGSTTSSESKSGGEGRASRAKNNKVPSYLNDCDRPACHETASAIQAAFQGLAQKSVPEMKVVDCPPDSVKLGRAGWTILHSMAAWYPDVPSSTEQMSMTQFLNAFADFYPCSYCAKDFRENIATIPPRVETRKSLSLWLCKQHNIVNKKLGKPSFSCTLNNLDQRWREGGSQCRDA